MTFDTDFSLNIVSLGVNAQMYNQHIYTLVYYSVQHGEHAYILGVNTAPACANYSVQYLELGRGWGLSPVFIRSG